MAIRIEVVYGDYCKARWFLNAVSLTVITLIIVFAAGCATVPRIDADALEKSSLGWLWEEADRLAFGGFYKQERMILEEIISRNPNDHKAFFHMEKSRFLEAEKNKEPAQYQKVKKAFDIFFDHFVVGDDPWAYPHTEEAVWVLALSYYRQINPPDKSQKETKGFIRTVEDRLFLHYPDTRYRVEAALMIEKARRNLAWHSLFIGDFYMRTWALTSAELHFKNLLDDYPGMLDEKVMERLREIRRLKTHPTKWEHFKRWAFFEKMDAEIDSAQIAQAEREKRIILTQEQEKELNK
ncbi:MAG: outer membrane protein assembly factor BamD [Parcubacteria group bacterium]|nr:outer membrane protein assembly factor BamD [Parcubacteria group bacterium]